MNEKEFLETLESKIYKIKEHIEDAYDDILDAIVVIEEIRYKNERRDSNQA